MDGSGIDATKMIDAGPLNAAPAAPSQRLLIVGLNYAPDMVGVAKYTTELAEEMTRRGHEVEVVAGPPYYPDWKVGPGYSGFRWTRERMNGVTVHRTPLYVPARPSGAKRLVHLASYAAAAWPVAIAAARRMRPTLVMGIAPTLLSAHVAASAARAVGAKSWLHIQDFEVDAAFELGLLKGERARHAALEHERKLLRRFDRVSSISAKMVERLAEKGVDPARCVELRNWVDIKAVPVWPTSDTPLRRELGIGPEKVVALYSGNMAAKQGLELLAQAAAEVEARAPEVVFLLCGAGPGRAELERQCAGRANVHFLDLQPQQRLGELLGSADIHLLPQKAEAADLVLPSKLTGMLASGRPVLATANEGTGLWKEVQGCGITVSACADALAEAIVGLATRPATRLTLGRAAREIAVRRWDDQVILELLASEISRMERGRSQMG